MIIVIYGEERLVMDTRIKDLKTKYDCNEENMNFSMYHVDEVSMDEVYEDFITPPFLTEKKMIVVRNPYFLSTEKPKSIKEKDYEQKSKKDIHYLEECLNHDHEDTILVLFYTGEKLDERRKIVKRLRKEATVTNVEKLQYFQLSDHVRVNVRRRNCDITQEAIELLLSRTGDDLLTVANEVEKLCLYTKDIDVKDVDALVPKPLEDNVFNLVGAIMNRDRKKIFSIYQDLMTLNEEPIKLIVMIANQMRLIYQVKLLSKKGYNDKETAKLLSINPYRMKYLRKEGNSFDLDELLVRIDELAKLDLAIKTGKMDKNKGLELFLMKI